MRKYLLILLWLSFSLSACSNVESVTQEFVVQTNSFKKSADEAINELQRILNDLDGKTRNNIRTIRDTCPVWNLGDNIVLGSDNANNPLAYIVNFVEGGYAIMGADRRQSPVYAIVYKGEMSADKLVDAKQSLERGDSLDTPMYVNALLGGYIISDLKNNDKVLINPVWEVMGPKWTIQQVLSC